MIPIVVARPKHALNIPNLLTPTEDQIEVEVPTKDESDTEVPIANQTEGLGSPHQSSSNSSSSFEESSELSGSFESSSNEEREDNVGRGCEDGNDSQTSSQETQFVYVEGEYETMAGVAQPESLRVE